MDLYLGEDLAEISKTKGKENKIKFNDSEEEGCTCE
jgi:hypothetical protein